MLLHANVSESYKNNDIHIVHCDSVAPSCPPNHVPIELQITGVPKFSLATQRVHYPDHLTEVKLIVLVWRQGRI